MPFLLIALLAAFVAITFLILFAIAYRRFKSTRKRTAPSDLKPPAQKFAFSVLRRATGSFSAENRVGQGGFGSVYKGVLDSGQVIAVKLMSEASTQGEFEFQNELTLASSIDAVCCPYLVSVIGFATNEEFRLRRRKKKVKKLALVYEFMENGSLQDALLDRKCEELMVWKKRFEVITCVAKGIDYLHNECVPGIVHGDVKPSNVLLDSNFDAKIADFGLAQVVKEESMIIEENDAVGLDENDDGLGVEGNDEVVVNVAESPESFCVRIPDEEVGSVLSEDSTNKKVNGREKSESKRDWWWKQENVGGLSESGRVKDYVMEWIGSEINKEERSKKDWGLVKSTSSVVDGVAEEKRKKLEWWGSLDRETFRKEKKNREPKEWWKEEFCEELCKKKKKKTRGSEGEMWWQKDEDVIMPEKKRRRSRGSRSSIDGDFRMGRRHSQDWTNGDIPKSGGISSTPSMRGTVCYIAPECGGGAQVSDKCDVYSFGVLLLVLVSGRRPLQVMASPMSEFERANLISWARQLAVNGKLLDLVDSNIQCLDQEQALLCITIALLCLQRSPNKRPAMRDIVQMLSGKSDPPNLPFEFSPSPPSNYPFKSRRKAR